MVLTGVDFLLILIFFKCDFTNLEPVKKISVI